MGTGESESLLESSSMMPNCNIESVASLMFVHRFTSTWSISRFCLARADEIPLSRSKRSPLKMSLYSAREKQLQ